MDVAQALSDLTEISSQIQAAVVLDADGRTLGSTLEGARGEELARSALELLAAAKRSAGERGDELAQVEISTGEGSVFLVRDGERAIAAVTSFEPTVGLVFYDLKSTLRSSAAEEKPKPRARKKEASDTPA